MKTTIEQILFFPRENAKITETISGLGITLKGCKPLGKPGAPAFPGKFIRVALPLQHKAASVKEEVLHSSRLTNKPDLVACDQEPRFVYLDEDMQPVTSGLPMSMPDKSIYEDAIRNKKDCVSLLRTEWISNVPAAVLEVVPVRYNTDGTIELVEILKVTIEVEEHRYKSPVPLKIRLKREQNLNKIHRMITNPQIIESIKLKKGDILDPAELPDSQDSRDIESGTRDFLEEVDYLIITDNNK